MGNLVRVGIIGYGYWGPNIARVINESSDASLVYCADLNSKALQDIKRLYKHIKITNNYLDILHDSSIDAIFVVTPTRTHFNIAKNCLLAKKHVFIEKPLAYSSNECRELIKIANGNNLKLMVGHVFHFNSSVIYIKNLLLKRALGKIRHLHFQRRSLGPIRKDVNVLWDLAPHDFSMLLYFVNEKPLTVVASGECYLQKNIEDIVNVSIKFENNIFANLILSWIDPIKIREITIVGAKKMVLFDDVQISGKVKIFDKNANVIKNTRGITFAEFQIALHSGGTRIPGIVDKEPLKEEVNHFISCIIENKNPITDGKSGLKVIRLLEAAQESLHKHSRVIKIT
ncbi:MAG: Gfo/Idh/MocA family oxidoreductase [Candidatus Levyibacteriota bacterium]|nr:MAG: Gfo/Idh/MocA family oxidoreductase [Candidatus Levybacteria bacterium]